MDWKTWKGNSIPNSYGIKLLGTYATVGRNRKDSDGQAKTSQNTVLTMLTAMVKFELLDS